MASGTYATALGGKGNDAIGQGSLAAGTDAYVANNGSFVWADAQNGYEYSDYDNQFKVRAGGGSVFDVAQGAGGQPAFSVNMSAGYVQIRNGGSDPFILCVNDNSQEQFAVANDGEVYSPGFNTTSDLNAKENFTPVNPKNVLGKILSMPVTQWNLKGTAGKEHIGPMAQDFHAAFGLNGDDDKHISLVDEGGVALAAIQGLNGKVDDKVSKLESENADLKQQLAALKEMVSQLNAKLGNLAK